MSQILRCVKFHGSKPVVVTVSQKNGPALFAKAYSTATPDDDKRRPYLSHSTFGSCTRRQPEFGDTRNTAIDLSFPW